MYRRVVFLLLLLVSYSGVAMAQTTVQPCPSGKVCTVFILTNGVLVGDKKVNGVVVKTGAEVWQDEVQTINDQFFQYHPDLDQNYVRFIPVYNTSEGFWKDNLQAGFQWTQQEIDAVSGGPDSLINWPGLGNKLLKAFGVERKFDAKTDKDLAKLVDTIGIWSAKGYRVVLVGHSQGTLYTNAAYEAIRTGKVVIPSIPSLPNSLKLTIVNIASVPFYVADRRGKYTTQCGDPITWVAFGNLPANVNNTIVPCPLAFVGSFDPRTWAVHFLGSAYLSVGLNSQKQIYRQFEDSIHYHKGCGNDANCLLKDDFSGSAYKGYLQQFGDALAAEGSTLQTANGALVLTSYNTYTKTLTGPGIAKIPARLTVRTGRVFGNSTTSFEYNSTGTGQTFIGLVNTRDNAVDGVEAASQVPGIETVEITARMNHPLVPLPEGDSYLGFIFARGETPDAVEAALREAHACLRFEIVPEMRLASV